jgi:hypothetical protein
MINWKFEVDDVVCSVEDMEAMERLVQMGWSKGKENKLKGSGYDADGPEKVQGCRRALDIDARDVGV